MIYDYIQKFIAKCLGWITGSVIHQTNKNSKYKHLSRKLRYMSQRIFDVYLIATRKKKLYQSLTNQHMMRCVHLI